MRQTNYNNMKYVPSRKMRCAKMTLALVLLVVTKENGFFRLAKIFET